MQRGRWRGSWRRACGPYYLRPQPVAWLRLPSTGCASSTRRWARPWGLRRRLRPVIRNVDEGAVAWGDGPWEEGSGWTCGHVIEKSGSGQFGCAVVGPKRSAARRLLMRADRTISMQSESGLARMRLCDAEANALQGKEVERVAQPLPPSRQRVLTPRIKERILAGSRTKPKAGSTHWTTRKLARELRVQPLVVRPVWAESRPHRRGRYTVPDKRALRADPLPTAQPGRAMVCHHPGQRYRPRRPLDGGRNGGGDAPQRPLQLGPVSSLVKLPQPPRRILCLGSTSTFTGN